MKYLNNNSHLKIFSHRFASQSDFEGIFGAPTKGSKPPEFSLNENRVSCFWPELRTY